MTTGVETEATVAARPVTEAPRPRDGGNLPAVRRLLRDYIAPQWAAFGAAVACMIVSSVASGTIPFLVNYAVKYLFLDKQAAMLTIIPAAAVVIMTIRAVIGYGGQTLIESVGERAITAAQRDIFDRLTRRDLDSLNAVHSSQFISTMLYDATQMRDAITKGV